MSSYIMGIDVGTSGTKTALFDKDGRMLGCAAGEYPLYQPYNGWAEQDPADWWNAACMTIAEVLRQSGVKAEQIKGIGLTGQMHSLVLLDENGEPLRKAILWCDQRTAKECGEITRKVGADRLVEITANPALTGFTASKILWVKNHEPETYRACKHILLAKDYIRYKLTGVFATEVSDASGMQLLDVPGRYWSSEILEKLDIDPALLARVYESPEVTGTVTGRAAALTGLAGGTPVVGGAGDNAAAAVGTGVVRDGEAFTTIGTSGVVFAHSSKITIDKGGRVHTFCCAVPGAWHVMGVTLGAGLSLQWFKKNFCKDLIAVAEKENKDIYDLMTEEAESVEIGAERLIYLPYLMAERTPHLDPECRGVFFGLSAIHERRHLIRAVMEGVGYSLCDCAHILKEMGIHLQDMKACGGGGKSRLWRQMLADLYECPVTTLQSDEGPALGAAILAGVGAGLYESVEAGAEHVIRIRASLMPVQDNISKYKNIYKLYQKLYNDLKDTFKLLAAV